MHTTLPLNSYNLFGLELALVPERITPCATLDASTSSEITLVEDMDAEFSYSTWVWRNILIVSKLLDIILRAVSSKQWLVRRIRKKNA